MLILVADCVDDIGMTYQLRSNHHGPEICLLYPVYSGFMFRIVLRLFISPNLHLSSGTAKRLGSLSNLRPSSLHHQYSLSRHNPGFPYSTVKTNSLAAMADNVLIVGASRGLGAELAKKYGASGTHTFATGRSDKGPDLGKNVTYVPKIDVSKEEAGSELAGAIKGKLSTVIITAGYFGLETFDEPKWDEQVKMYTISSIGPVFIVHHLVKAGLLEKGSKIILVSSESGSITLRHESEGGGNYGHHASKTALNMVGKLLSLDLKDKQIAVGMVQ